MLNFINFFQDFWIHRPHTMSSTPLPPFLSSLFWKQTEHLQHHLFTLLSFVFPSMFGYYLWYFLLLFPLQCHVYQSFIIPGKEEICKIFSPYSSPTSRPKSFFIKLFYSSVFQCYIPQKEQNTTTKNILFWSLVTFQSTTQAFSVY